MSMMVNPYRFAAPAPAADLADLFANGEIGDWWRFDAANTSANTVGDRIGTATGLVNGVLLQNAGLDATKPTLVQISGRDAASFGADILSHNFGSDIAQPGTIIVCLADTDTGATAIVTGSSSTKRWQISIDSGNDLCAFAPSELDSTINAPIGTRVLTVEFNGASSKYRSNGTQTATGNVGSAVTNQLTVGSLWDGTFGMSSGSIYSLLFINRLLTGGAGGELDRAERLLGSHAGLSW
jgi:hypothetical protein